MFSKHPKLYSFLVWLTCCLAYLYPSYDPDLGWHLRYGEYFFQHGRILTDNIFSWTVSQYQWINHSWLYDLIIFKIFDLFKFPGISIFACLLIGTSIYFSLKKTSHPVIHGIGLIILTTWSVPLLNVGLRSQLMSLFFFSLLWWLLTKPWQKNYHYLLPLLFWVWANTHGQFLIGICVWGIYLFTEYLQTKKLEFPQIATLLISTAVTFINPFGYHLHLDIISYLNSPILNGISEWQPWVWYTPHGLALMCYTAMTAFAFYKTKPPLKIFLPVLAISILSFRARRMIPWFLIISLPVLLEWLKLNLPKKLLKPSKHFLGYGIITLILTINLFRISQQPVMSQTWSDYCQGEVQCSEGLIDFLEQNHITGKIFNSYNLGGHLIYRYPQLPVFIDGRMILWQLPDGEFIYAQYAPMIHTHPSGKDLFFEYNFDYVILTRGVPLEKTLQDKFNWPVRYQDHKVIVLENPHDQNASI